MTNRTQQRRYPWMQGPSSKPAPVPEPPRPKLAVAPVERLGLSLHEAAAAIGVSASTLAALTKAGDGPPSFRLHRRKRRIYPTDSLRAWLAKCAAEAAAESDIDQDPAGDRHEP